MVLTKVDKENSTCTCEESRIQLRFLHCIFWWLPLAKQNIDVHRLWNGTVVLTRSPSLSAVSCAAPAVSSTTADVTSCRGDTSSETADAGGDDGSSSPSLLGFWYMWKRVVVDAAAATTAGRCRG